MNFKKSCYKFAQNKIRLMSTISKPKNHYNSLGIPSTSTQSEVKSAYYKLSMIYHPDKNQNPESSQKFRDIKEAYEVLGNTKTRRLYDKGFYFGRPAVVDDTIDKFHKSRETRSRPPHPHGRTPIYDFDEWSRSHYGATFHRAMERKRKENFYKMKQEQDLNDIKMEKMLFVFGILAIICMYMFRSSSNGYDSVTYFGTGMSTYNKNVKTDTEKD